MAGGPAFDLDFSGDRPFVIFEGFGVLICIFIHSRASNPGAPAFGLELPGGGWQALHIAVLNFRVARPSRLL
jgi:hypothetical protein